MYHFIPSWYEENSWAARYMPWYQETDTSTFDDTVNQIRLFREAGEETELVCLAYMPNLRRFLHRENIYPIPFWSAFDALQGVTWEKPAVLSYEELPWPIGIEWVYQPAKVLAYLGEDLYASIEFEESGSLCWIQYYETREGQSMLSRRDIYDDRGFRSSSVWYWGGQPRRQEYYSPKGDLCFYEDLKTGEITRFVERMVKTQEKGCIRTWGTDRLGRMGGVRIEAIRYRCMEDLIREAARGFFRKRLDREPYVVAANAQHNAMLLELLKEGAEQDVVLSFFGDRYDLSDKESLLRDAAAAGLVVTDTENAAKRIREAGVPGEKIYDISPFDTRLSLGRSQQIRELKVFMPLDGLEGIFRQKALRQVFEYMKRNTNVILQVGTRKESRGEQEAMAEEMRAVLEDCGASELQIRIPALPLEAGAPGEEPEERTAAEKNTAVRIEIVPYHSENDLIRILDDVRLIVDVRDQPDLYLQIAGISAGIPQVNYRFTRYVKHLKDGYIIENINFITGALEYYLEGLANWNEALVYCVQEVSRYTGGQLVDQWRAKTEHGSAQEELKRAEDWANAT